MGVRFAGFLPDSRPQTHFTDLHVLELQFVRVFSRKLVPKRATFSILPTASAYSNRYTLVERAIHGSMPLMLPFVVVNSWSIFVSFNVMRLFDAKLYDDFAQKYRSHEAAAIRLAALPQSEVVATSAAGRAATLS